MPQQHNGPLALPDEVRVVNAGLAVFGDAVRAQGAAAVDVDWRIPAGGDADLVRILTRLSGPLGDRVEEANRTVVARLDEGSPVLVGVASVSQVVPGVEERTVLHPGPRLEWERFCDPLRRSVRATVLAEGWADDHERADALVARGDVALEPANAHATVVPMATTLGPSAPVWVVEHPDAGNRAFSALNQGPGRTQWMGVDAPEAVDQLAWLRAVAAPVLDAVVRAAGPVELPPLAAQGLLMGDDLHMRVQAATNHLLRHLLPHLVGLDDPRRVEVARFWSRNHLFFLTLGMAAAKALVDAADEVEASSIVVAMARNGTTFGVRVAGVPGRWFVADAPPVGDALYRGDHGPDHAAADIGDSSVLELIGLGGAAAAASPAVAGFLGGTMDDAVASTRDIEAVSAARSSRFQIPFLDFRGTPLGVDARRVVRSEITPGINTGILHNRDGTGQIGAGVARAPLACFRDALRALDRRLT